MRTEGLGRTILVALVIAVLPRDAAAHGGGLDASGCHHNRRAGDYHCHRSQAALPSEKASSLAPAAPVNGRAYCNCAEARAAGAAPVRRGDPGYGPHLDRDNDGVGCE